MSEQDTLARRENPTQPGWYSNKAATFGDRVAAARDALGYSQAELARKIGVKQRTVEGWEDDLLEPRANKLNMLAGLLNVSLMWLLNGEGEGISDPVETIEGAQDVTEILAEIRTLRATIARAGDKLGSLEKRLRKALREPA